MARKEHISKGVLVTNEINHMNVILDKARVDHKMALYKNSAILGVLGISLLGLVISLWRYGFGEELHYSREFDRLSNEEDNLIDRFTNDWQLKCNGLCNYRYDGLSVCPVDPLITLECCKQLLTTFCVELNAVISKQDVIRNRNDALPIIAITLGVVAAAGTIAICVAFFSVGRAAIAKRKKEPYSHSFIPVEHRQNIYNLGSELGISMESTVPLRVFQNHLKEISLNHQRRLTFFKGGMEQNRGTALYEFLHQTERAIVYKILTYIDPLLPYLKKISLLKQPNLEANEEDSERASLLTYGSASNV